MAGTKDLLNFMSEILKFDFKISGVGVFKSWGLTVRGFLI